MFCLKSGIKICKIQKPVRNIPRNNVIKDNRTLFLNAVNNSLVKNSYYAWWFISWLVKLLRVTNFERKKMKVLKSYLCYKTTTSQNVPSEAQVKNLFLFRRKVICSVLKIFKFFIFKSYLRYETITSQNVSSTA